ncbi:MAG: tetratricopeptide repeat protein [Candidatus Euphemobacter frigidus]|nr:tetratricopeptide repeat protein [Candidatus Euphemobacter frigidus]MDP8276073.1 tetratricopeptide repeat protein [Candidatus Euphemobacter frigidus]
MLIVVPLIVFGSAGRYGFVGWDDDIHVYNNLYLTRLTPGNILHFWATPHEAMYIPVTFTAWTFLSAFSRLVSPASAFDPSIFHHADIFLHLINVLLLYGILKLLLRGSSRDPGRIEWAAGLGALLFAIHPLQVEPVIWISSLKDVLCGFFSLVALGQYLRYAQAVEINRKLPHVNRRKRRRCGVIATVAFGLALLSKAAAVPVVALAWLLVHFRWRDSELTGRRGCLKALFQPPFTLLFLWLGMTLPVIFLAAFAEEGLPLGYIAPLWGRFLIALDAIAFYLYQLVLPLNVGIDYGRTPELVMSGRWLYFIWIFPVALTAGLLFLKGRRRLLIVLGIFVIGVLPTLGLVPHGYQVFSTVADRFLYLSMIGPALALSWLFLRCRKSVVTGLCVVILGLLALSALVQARYWGDNITLFRHALAINPRSYMANYNLGLTLSGEGKPEEAIRHYERAIEIKPDYGRAHNNLGAILTEQGRRTLAISHYAEAYRLDPGNGRAFFNLYCAHNDLGIKLADAGDREEAIIQYREAINVNPYYAEAYNNLGNALAARGELKEASAQYRRALRIKPDYAMAANNLGIALIRQGKQDEAIKSFVYALQVNPGFTQARQNLERARRSLP